MTPKTACSESEPGEGQAETSAPVPTPSNADGATSPVLVLVGPMGAGKSSIGRRVAKALGVPFTDSDTVIVRAHGPIAQIFDEHGEPYFRELERAAVHEALARPGVLALGGGAVLHPETRAELAGHRVALLTVDARTVASRLRDDSRPLLRGSGTEEWQRIFDERRAVYDAVATDTFDTSRGPLKGVVDAILAWIRSLEKGTT